MNWQTDWGLRGRMLVTAGLLAVLYIGFVVVLVEVLNTAPVVALLLVGGLSFVQYFYSDSLALRSMGASRVEEAEYPDLHQRVTRLAQQADLPKPDVAVADSHTPNAFATGRNQENAVVCVTTGLLETLDEEELDGVLAHELAHVKNRDVMVMTIASFLSTVAFMVVRYGAFFGGGRNRNGGIVVAIGASLITWIVSFLLIRALSRYREYAADRGAAQITGNPSALASALLSISGKMDRVPSDDLREQSQMNAFFIIPVSSGVIGKLFRTHPTTENRIERLQELQAELA
ncbi:MAG: zinc metalloprotease HtpX [Salinarchaeum sp.]